MSTTQINKSASALFRSVKVGDILCKNAVVMAPLTRGKSTVDNHVPNKIMAEYYAQRASAGLIIAEATNINREAIGWYKSPGIWSEEQVQAWKPVTEAVHNKNGKIVLQLWHTGRRAHSSLSNNEIVSASAIPLSSYVHGPNGKRLDPETPRKMSYDDIKRTIKDYGMAAKNAMKAGFDGVEIHAANGYLIDQFLQSVSNKRTDEYGGSIENRLRFLQEIIEEIGTQVPMSKVGIRFSPHGDSGDMGSEDNIELFNEAIKMCTRANLAYLHIMDGVFFKRYEGIPQFTLKAAREAADQIKERKDRITIIGNSGYDKEKAERALEEKYADMIAFGVPFMSNPDLVERFAYGIALNEPAKFEHWFSKNDEEDPAIGYTDYPFAKIPTIDSTNSYNDIVKKNNNSNLNTPSSINIIASA